MADLDERLAVATTAQEFASGIIGYEQASWRFIKTLCSVTDRLESQFDELNNEVAELGARLEALHHDLFILKENTQ